MEARLVEGHSGLPGVCSLLRQRGSIFFGSVCLAMDLALAEYSPLITGMPVLNFGG